MASYKVSDRSVVVSIVVVLCLIYTPYVLSHRAAGIRFLQGDSYYYRAAVVSLLEDGDLLLANNITGRDLLEGEQLALGTRGLVPKHPIIMPLVSLPFYYVLQERGLLLFNLLDTILLIVLIYKVNRLFFSEYVSFATAQLYATATLFLDYSYNYSPDVFSTVLVLGGLYFALRARYHAGATLLGLAIFAKVSNVVLVAPVVFYMFAVIWGGRRDAEARAGFSAGKLRALLGVCMTFLLALLPFAYTNYELLVRLSFSGTSV
jgi:Dolichyl-phosphate-mannose-protein mannosyltransferase